MAGIDVPTASIDVPMASIDVPTASIDIVHAINSVHRRILPYRPPFASHEAEVIVEICGEPYAFECACALANDKTASVWFFGACTHGLWSLMRWLTFVYGDANAEHKNAAFKVACDHGHASVAWWLINTGWFGTEDASYIVRSASQNGMFRLTKRLLIHYESYFRGNGNLFIHKQGAFAAACKYNCIWFIRWLDRTYGLTLDDVRAYQMDAFRAACVHGHWSLARWMAIRFGLIREHIRETDSLPLVYACTSGQLHIARWLVEYFRLTAQDVRSSDNAPFRGACYRGHLELVQWMSDRFHLTARDARSHNNDALIMAARAGNIDIVRWLVCRFGLGREGSRVNYGPGDWIKYTKAPIDIIKWLSERFTGSRQQELAWQRVLVNAAANEDRAGFAWWAAKRFGIMPYGFEAASEMYRRMPGVTEQHVERARLWLAAFAAEW